jgi:hypothetical protein
VWCVSVSLCVHVGWRAGHVHHGSRQDAAHIIRARRCLAAAERLVMMVGDEQPSERCGARLACTRQLVLDAEALFCCC